MLQREFLSKTLKHAPADEMAQNSILLIRGGFVDKAMAGVYTFLPLGWRVLNKIENIVRDEMDRTGARELLMPALHPKDNWEKTGRWESFDALFKIKSNYSSEFALGPTHEEIIYPMLSHFIESFRDLPVFLYQIQTKFRDEPRAKSGLLRGREFRMKDLYSFHVDNSDRDQYYKEIRDAYHRIFKRTGIQAIDVEALGGTFSEHSLEFQVLSDAGEDEIYFCEHCRVGKNKELALTGDNKDKCRQCKGKTKIKKSIEVGNIFPLKDKFAEDFGLRFKDEKQGETLVSAGCYGLGTTRLLGTIVEVHSDKKGIIWPDEVAPFKVHLIGIMNKKSGISAEGGSASGGKNQVDKIYGELLDSEIEVLYDDREDKTAGEKFADADLIGIPWRIVVSEKTIAKDAIEVKRRGEDKTELIPIKSVVNTFKD